MQPGDLGDASVTASTVDGADERQQADRPDQARRGGQREQVVAAEQRLQDDVVERERERRAENEERALCAPERQALPAPERDDHDDAGEREREADDVPEPDAFEPGGRREDDRDPRRERDDERGDPEVVCGVPKLRKRW